MNTEIAKLSQIHLNSANPRKIKDWKFDKLVDSILVLPKMLELRPVVVDNTMTVLGGNMRYRALCAISDFDEQEIHNRLNSSKDFQDKTQAERDALVEYWLAWKDAPTIEVANAANLSDAEKREFIIKDNVNFGEWDFDILANEWDSTELDDWGVDVWQNDVTPQGDSDDLVSGEDNYDVTEVPSRCSIGDVWKLGRHKLMCGDSTKAADIDKLMGGEQADLLLTDPPYNVNYHGGTSKMTIANDNMDDESFIAFLTAAFSEACRIMRPGAAFYIWHADSRGFEFRRALKNAGLSLRETLIWVKNVLSLGRQDYQWRHEPCLYGWKDGAAHYFVDDRSQSTVLEDAGIDYRELEKDELLKIVLRLTDVTVPNTVIYEDKPAKNDIHPTMKPVKLMARLIKNSARPEELVLDLFGGGGSTLVACEQLNRKCYIMEYDTKYCDAIIDRWERLTGRRAELEK